MPMGIRKFLETMEMFYVLIAVVVIIFVYIFVKIHVTLKGVSLTLCIFNHNIPELKELQKR